MTSPTIPIRPESQKSGAFEYICTRKDELIGWARKFSLFPYPFVTACCGMEFMSVSATPYDTDRFGAALPRYNNYAAVQGIDRIVPVDVYVPGCPPRPEMVIDGIMKLQEKIAGQQHLIVNDRF
jgi:NADH-quinone oxidoreductase subunit B